MSQFVTSAHSRILRRATFSSLAHFGLGLALTVSASCSKGGMPDQPSCGKLMDQTTSKDTPLPKMLYAELRSSSGGVDSASIGVTLSGSGGIYSGMYAFGKCDAPGTYYAERLVLMSASGNPVATAVRLAPNNSYEVTYANGNMTTATGTFTNSVSYSVTGAMRPVNVAAIMPLVGSARQGERISMQIGLNDESGCGVKESQWWLTPLASPGTKSTDVTILDGGSGSSGVHVGPRLTAGTYVIEGQVTLRNGRVLMVRRSTSSDTTYKLYESTGALFSGDLSATVTQITIADNPDADRTPPVAWGASAAPVGPNRCDQVGLSMLLTDDRGLSNQTVKMILGTADKPNLATATLSGNDLLTGNFTVPSDAPYGLWYAYPDTVRDAAGNEAKGVFSNGRFHLVGDGTVMMTDVMAGAFILSNPQGITTPDLGGFTPNLDGGTTPPDLSGSQFPATLAGVSVMAPMPPTKVGDTVTVQMTWNDLAMIL